MPQKSKLDLIPIELSNESIGERIARLRKEKGWTQNDLAEKTGLIQSLISSYETNRLKLSAEMAARFAQVLNISTDTIIGFKLNEKKKTDFSLRYAKRIQKLEALPKAKQKMILKTLDALIREAEMHK